METLDIPEVEKVGPSSDLVSQEEMDAELKRMREAVAESTDISEQKNPEDQERLEKVRQSLKEIADSKTPEERSRDEETLLSEMREAMTPDWKKGGGNNIDNPTNIPPEEPPKNGNEGGDGKNTNENGDSITMDMMHTKYEYDPCPVCGGSGRKWFILPCFSCGGTGNVLASKHTEWSSKEIPLKDKTEQSEEEKAEQTEDIPGTEIPPAGLDGRQPDEKKRIV